MKEYKWIYCGIQTLACNITSTLRTQIASNATFVKELQQLYYEEDTKNITIEVADGKLRAHKIILTSRSPVFRGMFNAKMKERDTGLVTIPNFSFKTFSVLLEFIYTNSCTRLDKANAEEIMQASDMYEVSGLKQLCGTKLLKNIIPNYNFSSSKEIFKKEAIIWAIKSFKPYKSAGPDGIFRPFCSKEQISFSLIFKYSIPKAMRGATSHNHGVK